MNALTMGAFDDAAQATPKPLVFAKSISTLSGLPWDQRSLADLEARMGAPAPINELEYRLVRLQPWGLGQAGRFGVLYLRARDVVDGFVAEAIIEGCPVKVVFKSAQARAALARTRLYRLTALLAGLCLLAGAIFAAFSARTDRETRLEALEHTSQIVAHQSAVLLNEKAQARLLESSGLQGKHLFDAIADIDWAARSKSPLAHIQSVHWESGLMTITTRGEAPPFSNPDRQLRKSDRPVGPAEWLWGVGRDSAHPAELGQ